MLSVLMLEPDVPLLVQEVALLLALIPVMRLLPPELSRALGLWPYATVALYALDRLGVAIVSDVRFVQRQWPVLRTIWGRLLVGSAVLGWLLYSMHRFRVLRPLHGAASAVMGFGLEIGEVSLHLGDLLVFLFSAWLAFWIARCGACCARSCPATASCRAVSATASPR